MFAIKLFEVINTCLLTSIYLANTSISVFSFDEANKIPEISETVVPEISVFAKLIINTSEKKVSNMIMLANKAFYLVLSILKNKDVHGKTKFTP